jgi:protoporphyrinogen oxidase
MTTTFATFAPWRFKGFSGLSGSDMYEKKSDTLIMGAGLAGLSAGYVLSRAGMPVVVVEGDHEVGGLAKTVHHNGFRFDLGGHRFLTRNKAVERFVAGLLKDDLTLAPRKSRIFLRGRYFDYPLRPANALIGLGIPATLHILSDYGAERIAGLFRKRPVISLEDWVVGRFGRKMFELYFRDYSEKVWGIASSRISAEWVAQRIAGLSLWEAVKNAFSKRSGRGINTLADRFLYPAQGIGRIAHKLSDEIAKKNPVKTDTRVLRVHHEDFTVKSVLVRSGDDVYDIEADEFIASIPLTAIVRMLHPAPPDRVREAALRLRYRDLVVVTVMLDREQITDLSWMYLPEKHIPLGRIHEPKNWSPLMAPEGKTHLVAEYFCFRGDAVWNATDRKLTDLTVRHLSRLGFFGPHEVIDSCVVRVPRAYPVLDIEYRRRHDRIMGYLKNFTNLHVIGRGGTFQYLNMDHAIESGMKAAEAILKKPITDRENKPVLIEA